MAGLHFELVSPARLLFSGEVTSVTLPGTEGDMGIFAGHAPVLSTLRPGVVVVTKEGGATDRIFVRGGFAEVNPQGLTLLAETAIPLAELDAGALAAAGQECRRRPRRRNGRLSPNARRRKTLTI